MRATASHSALDVAWYRRQFPALKRTVDGRPAVFFDGPGGSQVPQRVIDRVGHYLGHANANHGGLFAMSRESGELLEEAHQALAELGRTVEPGAANRRAAIEAAYAAIAAYERRLADRLLNGLAAMPDVNIWGITDPVHLACRVPTVAITHRRFTPREMAQRLGTQGFFVWHGNFYALPLTEALGLEPEGLLRIGLLHYNTEEEVERLLVALTGP